MTKLEKRIIRLFSDAHIIDVNFAQWDTSVELIAVADHLPSKTPGKRPIFRVVFEDILRFSFRYLKTFTQRPKRGLHMQWMIYQPRIQFQHRMIRFVGRGSDWAPVLEIDCRRVRINSIRHTDLDYTFPKWDKPGSPFVRPGIKTLIANKKRHQNIKQVRRSANFEGK